MNNPQAYFTYSDRRQLAERKQSPLQYDELPLKLRRQIASTLVHFINSVKLGIPASRIAAINRELPRFVTSRERYTSVLRSDSEEQEAHAPAGKESMMNARMRATAKPGEAVKECELDEEEELMHHLWPVIWRFFHSEMGLSWEKIYARTDDVSAQIRMNQYFEGAATEEVLDAIDIVFQSMMIVFVTIAEDRRCDVRKLFPCYSSAATSLNRYFIRASVGYQMLPIKHDKRDCDDRFSGLVITKIDAKYPRRDKLRTSAAVMKELHADLLEFVQSRAFYL